MYILVPSSNKTGWMCRAMLWLLDRHWPAHPPVIVGGYDKPDLPPGVEFYKIGEWKDYPVNRWSDGVIRFVHSISEPLFCFTMDDFWLCQDVDNEVVADCISRLRGSPAIDRIDLTADRANSGHAIDAGHWSRYTQFITTPPEAPYQHSFQTGLWRRAAILKYMQAGETPAESEIRGSDRMSRGGAVVLGTRQAPVKYLIAMQHGQLHIDDSGYQVPPVALLPEDKAELARLGYLTPPEQVMA